VTGKKGKLWVWEQVRKGNQSYLKKKGKDENDKTKRGGKG